MVLLNKCKVSAWRRPNVGIFFVAIHPLTCDTEMSRVGYILNKMLEGKDHLVELHEAAENLCHNSHKTFLFHTFILRLYPSSQCSCETCLNTDFSYLLNSLSLRECNDLRAQLK